LSRCGQAECRRKDSRLSEIVSGYGDTTILTTNADGFLEDVTNPESETVSMVYDGQEETLGLLTSFTNGRGQTYDFTYSSTHPGRIEKDTDPAGGEKTFTRTDFESIDEIGFSVDMTTKVGPQETRTTGYYSGIDMEYRVIHITNTFPGGFAVTADIFGDVGQDVSYPDGTQVFVTWFPDDRWGLQSRHVRSLKVQTPQQAADTTSYLMTSDITADLAVENDPLSLTALTRTTTINGKTYHSVFTPNEHATGIHGRTVTTPEARTLHVRLDDQMRVLEQGMSGLYAYRYYYDSHGRLQEVQRGTTDDLRLWTLAYYSSSEAYPGRLHTVTDPLGQITAYTEYDGAGRPLKVALPSGRAIRYLRLSSI
jgi:YD repeat-containing protein